MTRKHLMRSGLGQKQSQQSMSHEIVSALADEGRFVLCTEDTTAVKKAFLCLILSHDLEDQK